MSFFNYSNRGDYGTEVNVGKIIAHAVIGFILLIFIFGSFAVVDAGERGVKTRLGEIVGTYEPGLHLKLPLIERMNIMNVRTHTIKYELEEPLFAASRDLQDVQVATVINYHIDPTKVEYIYQQYGTVEAYEANMIRPAVRDTVKSAASEYTAEELVTKRAAYNDSVAAQLSERLFENFSVVVERVNITNIQFSKSFTESIEQKVTAEQQALKAERDLERVEFEAQQRIEEAKGEAEAIRIQAQAITQQGGKDYVQLKTVEKWDGRLPQQFVPGSAVPFLNLTN